MSKTLQFFAYAFGSVLGPIALLGALAFWGASQPTTGFRPELASVSGSQFTDAAAAIGGGVRVSPDPAAATLGGVPAAARGQWADGTSVLMLGGGSSSGDEVLDRALERLGSHGGLQSGSMQAVHYRSFSLPGGLSGRGLAADRFCAIVTGPDPAKVDQHTKELAVFPHLQGNFVSRALDEHTGETIIVLVGVILVWAVLQMGIWPRLATRAVRRDPEPGVAPLPGPELEARLLALNALAAPFQVKPGKRPHRFVAEWRYLDATWAGLMQANHLARTARIELRLDPRDHTVRAVDHESELAWGAGTGGLNLSWSASRGITFGQIERGAVFGLRVEHGRPTLQPYTWRFNVQEMKQPIIDIVTQSGWAWRPVIFFNRLLNG